MGDATPPGDCPPCQPFPFPTAPVVGKNGQISLGKALAGTGFLVEQLPGGDIVLRRAAIVPVNERWLHQPAMREKLAQADAWMRTNPPAETSLEELEAARRAVDHKHKHSA